MLQNQMGFYAETASRALRRCASGSGVVNAVFVDAAKRLEGDPHCTPECAIRDAMTEDPRLSVLTNEDRTTVCDLFSGLRGDK